MCLKNTVKHDMQKLFNVAARGMLRQMKRSETEYSGTCKYRTERDGQTLKCAVGMMISDNVFQPEMNDYGSFRNSEIIQNAVAKSQKVNINSELINLGQTIQSIHDTYQPENWKAKLSEVARINHLRMPDVETERKQQIFNIVVKHLRKQGKPALNTPDHLPRCLYRSPDGLKCAAGCLIPDDKYTPSLEGRLNETHYKIIGENLGFTLTETEINLIRDLQNIHDNVAVHSWESGFKNIAIEFKLRYYPSQAKVKN